MADDIGTKPTIETVLERLGAFRDAVESRLGNIETDVSELRTGLTELRRDVAAGFHKTGQKVGGLVGRHR